jgi:hypothetical protein
MLLGSGVKRLRLTAAKARQTLLKREALTPKAATAHHSVIDQFTHHYAKFQLALSLACVLALTLALFCFFPDLTRAASWNPNTMAQLLGP